MTPPSFIGAMSSSRVILGGLLSSRARLRFPGRPSCSTHSSRSHKQIPANGKQGFYSLSHEKGSL
jgi:hypothetical protein